uniref:Homeobox protein araucan n=1 Tax=Mesocestoides corti TaxID=53468 RepID=A0A5K3FZR5_MESCO
LDHRTPLPTHRPSTLASASSPHTKSHNSSDCSSSNNNDNYYYHDYHHTCMQSYVGGINFYY